MTEYMLIKAEGIENLERRVDSFLAKGWSVTGGIAIDRHPNWEEADFYQAITREVNGQEVQP